jgi:hypothetical protein
VNDIQPSPELGIQGPQPSPVAPGQSDGARGFWALIVTQFQGAFSDNTLRWLTTFIIMQSAMLDAQRDRLISIVGALFAVPFIFFR